MMRPTDRVGLLKKGVVVDVQRPSARRRRRPTNTTFMGQRFLENVDDFEPEQFVYLEVKQYLSHFGVIRTLVELPNGISAHVVP
jgi:hypothetical protein